MNKPRLIDANKLKCEDLCDICKSADCSNCFADDDFKQWLNDQPTAYDIDKVVEELEELKQLSIRNECVRHGKCPDHCNAHYVSRAIEIVKGGAE